MQLDGYVVLFNKSNKKSVLKQKLEVIKIIIREVNIEMNPQELAEKFWNMDSAQQADFFNILADIIEENQGRGIMQLDYIVMENALYPHGAKLINMLADKIKEV